MPLKQQLIFQEDHFNERSVKRQEESKDIPGAKHEIKAVKLAPSNTVKVNKVIKIKKVDINIKEVNVSAKPMTVSAKRRITPRKNFQN